MHVYTYLCLCVRVYVCVCCTLYNDVIKLILCIYDVPTGMQQNTALQRTTG